MSSINEDPTVAGATGCDENVQCGSDKGSILPHR